MRKDPRVYLLHMLECVRRIEAYTSEGEERFMRDTLIQDAVLRNLQVLGEVAKHKVQVQLRLEVGHFSDA